jgi:hypothetical protein
MGIYTLRTGERESMEYDGYDALLIHVHQQLSPLSLDSAVALRTVPFHFRIYPSHSLSLAPFLTAVSQLNPAIAVRLFSPAVHAALNIDSPPKNSIHLDHNTKIQIIPNISALPRADKDQSAAFIVCPLTSFNKQYTNSLSSQRDERLLVVWSDDLDAILPLVNDIHTKLITLAWSSRISHPRSSNISSPSATASYVNLSTPTATPNILSPAKFSFFSNPDHLSHTEKQRSLRPIRLLAPFYAGLAAALSICPSLLSLYYH